VQQKIPYCIQFSNNLLSVHFLFAEPIPFCELCYKSNKVRSYLSTLASSNSSAVAYESPT